MNIRDYTEPKPRYWRWSDPDPEWWKEEQLDGRRIWGKQIDPLTQRPVVQLLRHEARAEQERENADAQD